MQNSRFHQTSKMQSLTIVSFHPHLCIKYSIFKKMSYGQEILTINRADKMHRQSLSFLKDLWKQVSWNTFFTLIYWQEIAIEHNVSNACHDMSKKADI